MIYRAWPIPFETLDVLWTYIIDLDRNVLSIRNHIWSHYKLTELPESNAWILLLNFYENEDDVTRVHRELKSTIGTCIVATKPALHSVDAEAYSVLSQGIQGSKSEGFHPAFNRRTILVSSNVLAAFCRSWYDHLQYWKEWEPWELAFRKMAFHLFTLSAGKDLQFVQLPSEDEPPLKPMMLPTDIPEKMYYWFCPDVFVMLSSHLDEDDCLQVAVDDMLYQSGAVTQTGSSPCGHAFTGVIFSLGHVAFVSVTGDRSRLQPVSVSLPEAVFNDTIPTTTRDILENPGFQALCRCLCPRAQPPSGSATGVFPTEIYGSILEETDIATLNRSCASVSKCFNAIKKRLEAQRQKMGEYVLTERYPGKDQKHFLDFFAQKYDGWHGLVHLVDRSDGDMVSDLGAYSDTKWLKLVTRGEILAKDEKFTVVEC